MTTPERGLARSQVRTKHFDDLGSTPFLTGSEGTVTDKYTYDAWGKVTGRTGTTAQPYQYVGRLGYYTHVQDENMDLLQLGVRFYDPETGRFTQVDAAGVHREAAYVYAADCPPSWFDPLGLKPVNVSGDTALKKCLDKLRRCVPWTRDVIGQVGNDWYVDPSLGASAETTWWHPGEPFRPQCCYAPDAMIPPLVFGPWITLGGLYPDDPWARRHGRFDDFCTTVLHELLHVSHGFWRCTFLDALIESTGSGMNRFQGEAENIYKRRCN